MVLSAKWVAVLTGCGAPAPQPAQATGTAAALTLARQLLHLTGS
jgi:hypothetical protein